jgi:Flp pilus assembly protein TadG
VNCNSTSHRPVRRAFVGRGVARRGATTVEMAVVLIPFLLFIFGIFDFGRFVMVRNLVESAAREGCRLAAVNTDVNNNSDNQTTAAIQQKVLNMLAGQTLQNQQIQIYKTNPAGQMIVGEWSSATYQQGIAVEITGNYAPLLTGWILGANVPVKCKAVMNSEGN